MAAKKPTMADAIAFDKADRAKLIAKKIKEAKGDPKLMKGIAYNKAANAKAMEDARVAEFVKKKAAAKKAAAKPASKTTTKAPAKAPVKKKVLVMPGKISPSKMTPAQKARYLKNPERYDY
jgi:hypothetical protein